MPIDFAADAQEIWINPDAEFAEEIEYFAPADAATGKTIWSEVLEDSARRLETGAGRYQTDGIEVRILTDTTLGIAAPTLDDKIRVNGADFGVVELSGPHEGVWVLTCAKQTNEKRGDSAARRSF